MPLETATYVSPRLRNSILHQIIELYFLSKILDAELKERLSYTRIPDAVNHSINYFLSKKQ